MKFSPFFLPHFLGAPRSEGFCFQGERLLYGREPRVFRAEPGKQKMRSRQTQELARSSAQENERQKKAGPTGLRKNRLRGPRRVSTAERRKICGPVLSEGRCSAQP